MYKQKPVEVLGHWFLENRRRFSARSNRSGCRRHLIFSTNWHKTSFGQICQERVCNHTFGFLLHFHFSDIQRRAGQIFLIGRNGIGDRADAS